MNDDHLALATGRKEVFEVADDEQLIGFKFDYDDVKMRSFTWYKCKLHD